MTQPESAITAGAKAAVDDLVASIQKSVTDAVADAAQQITKNFAEHVDKELTDMTAKFKATHPAVTAAVTDVVGYADAINTTAKAVEDAAGQVKSAGTAMKQLPGSIRDVRTELRDASIEAGKLGRDLKQMAGGAPAALRNLATTIGTNLKTALTAVKTGASDAAGMVGRFLTGARGMATAAVKAAKETKAWAVIQRIFNLVASMNPIGLVVLAIGLLVTALVIAYKRSSTFRDIVNSAFAVVKTVVLGAVNAVRNVIAVVWPYVAKVIQTAVSTIKSVVSTAFNTVKSVSVTVWNGLKTLISGVIKAVLTTISGISKIVGVVKGAFEQAKTAAGTALSGLVGFVKDLPGKVVGALGNIGKALYSKGRDLIQGFINGIKDMAGNIASTIQNSIIDKIPGPIKKALDIHSPSRLMAGIGQNIGEGLVVGIDGSGDRVAEAMTRLVPVPKSATVKPAMAELSASVLAKAVNSLNRVRAAADSAAVTVNVHPRAGQSEYEIGRVAAREVAWAAKF